MQPVLPAAVTGADKADECLIGFHPSNRNIYVNSPIEKLNDIIYGTIDNGDQPPNSQGALNRAPLTSLIAAIDAAVPAQPVPAKTLQSRMRRYNIPRLFQ